MNAKKIISSIGVGAGAVILGLGLQYAAAQTWSPAHQTPPNCDPTLDSGCNAPINVGSSYQAKAGGITLGSSVATTTIPLDVEGVSYAQALIVGKNIAKTFQYLDGNQGAGKVLTSDASGNATWQTTASSGGSGSTGTCSETPTTYTGGVHQNTTGTKIVVIGYGDFVSAFTGPTATNLSKVDSDGSSIVNSDGTSYTTVPGDVTFIVPPGYYYQLFGTSGVSVASAAWQICESGGTVSATPSGTVGGGCYITNGVTQTTGWGNASSCQASRNSQTQVYTLSGITCPANYSSQNISVDSSVCIHN